MFPSRERIRGGRLDARCRELATNRRLSKDDSRSLGERSVASGEGGARGNRVTMSTFVSPFCTRHQANIKRLTLIELGQGSWAPFLLPSPIIVAPPPFIRHLFSLPFWRESATRERQPLCEKKGKKRRGVEEERRVENGVTNNKFIRPTNRSGGSFLPISLKPVRGFIIIVIIVIPILTKPRG